MSTDRDKVLVVSAQTSFLAFGQYFATLGKMTLCRFPEHIVRLDGHLRRRRTGISQLFTLAWEFRISIVTAPGGNLNDWERRYGYEEEGDQEIAQGKANRANQIAHNQNEVARWTAGG